MTAGNRSRSWSPAPGTESSRPLTPDSLTLPEALGVIGRDEIVHAGEVRARWHADPLADLAWTAYERHFQGFTGATLDPQFHRLAHPATQTGRLRCAAGTTAVVVGAGPSLAANAADLKGQRARLWLVTSPRGAAALGTHGLVPDLVLVEHQTALDAHHSARGVADGDNILASCPLVAADWRTPAMLLAGIPSSRLFVPEPLPTWGLWPATAAALALDGGASTVALVGVDLGTPDRTDPVHAPLIAVLELLARASRGRLADCGQGAPKPGWARMALRDIGGLRAAEAPVLDRRDAPSTAARREAACAEMAVWAPLIGRVRAWRTDARRARAGGRVPSGEWPRALDELIGWREDRGLRRFVQETLGANFLPRFWRMRIDLTPGTAPWRPVLLAADEIVAQADALAAVLAVERAA